MTFEGFAPAKVNLTLQVTGQRNDGYHLLDSLVVFADIGDRLWFTPDTALSIELSGPFAAGVPTDAANLIWQAADLAGWTGHIHLEKNLPHGAGIGSGSSDAAAVLRALGYRGEGALTLGADVPVCILPQAQRMRGIGEHLTAVPQFPRLNAVLVNPNVPLSTPPVFKALHQKENPAMPEPLPSFTSAQSVAAWLQGTRNDLQTPALSIAPEIAEVLTSLDETNPQLSRMSGSGATCFTLYETAEDAQSAAHILHNEHPSWWVQNCTLN